MFLTRKSKFTSSSPIQTLKELYEVPIQHSGSEYPFQRQDNVKFALPELKQQAYSPSRIKHRPVDSDILNQAPIQRVRTQAPSPTFYFGQEQKKEQQTPKPYVTLHCDGLNLPSSSKQDIPERPHVRYATPKTQFELVTVEENIDFGPGRVQKGYISNKQVFSPFDKHFGLPDHPHFDHAQLDASKPQNSFKKM